MLDLLFFAPTQAAIGIYSIFFLILSIVIGRLLRSYSVEGAAFGFLTLCGASALTMFAMRWLAVPLIWFAPLTLLTCLAIVVALRQVLPPGPRLDNRNQALFVAVSGIIVLVVWSLRIIQLDPSSSLSSHHGWYPLYIQESYRLGHLAQVAETSFGQGYLTSIFYNVDLMGLVALGTWFDHDKAWAVYSAGSTLAACLSMVLVARSLRGSQLALLLYGAMVMALLASDFLYRTALVRNWGDALLFLPGALMLFHMNRGDSLRSAALWTAASAIFLVFARHYGAFYAGLILAAGFFALWRWENDRRLAPWVVLSLLLTLFSLREILCVVFPPSPFYPGSRLLDAVPVSGWFMFVGALNDLGLMQGNELVPGIISPRNLWLPALVALVWVQRRRLYCQPRRRLVYVAPLMLLIMPQVLQILVGYRSSIDYSKTNLIAVHLAAFLPAFVIGRLVPDRSFLHVPPRWRGAVLAALPVVGVAVGLMLAQHQGLPWRNGPGAALAWGFERYRSHNTEYSLAQTLRRELGAEFSASVTDRPILYVHYEPGLSIRHYVGGKFFCDLDFWSQPVQGEFGKSRSLAELVARLGYPNIYLSLGTGFVYGRYFSENWQPFAEEMTHLEDAPWVERVVRYESAAFFVTRPDLIDIKVPRPLVKGCPGQ